MFLQTYIIPVHDIAIIQVTTQLYNAINNTRPFRNVHIQLMKGNVTYSRRLFYNRTGVSQVSLTCHKARSTQLSAKLNYST